MNQTLQIGDVPQGPSISRNRVIFIEEITFVRECVARCLEASYEGTASIFPLPTVNDCLSTAPDDLNIAFVLYAIHHRRASDREVEQNMSKLLSAFPAAPIILLAEGEGADRNLAALRRGARGYIPTSATLDIAIGATQVVRAGGTFVPASSLGGTGAPHRE